MSGTASRNFSLTADAPSFYVAKIGHVICNIITFLFRNENSPRMLQSLFKSTACIKLDEDILLIHSLHFCFNVRSETIFDQLFQIVQSRKLLCV